MEAKDKLVTAEEVKYVHDKLNMKSGKLTVPIGEDVYSVKFAVPDGKPTLIYEEIEQEE